MLMQGKWWSHLQFQQWFMVTQIFQILQTLEMQLQFFSFCVWFIVFIIKLNWFLSPCAFPSILVGWVHRLQCVSLYVCLFVCVSVCLSVCLSVCSEQLPVVQDPAILIPININKHLMFAYPNRKIHYHTAFHHSTSRTNPPYQLVPKQALALYCSSHTGNCPQTPSNLPQRNKLAPAHNSSSAHVQRSRRR